MELDEQTTREYARRYQWLREREAEEGIAIIIVDEWIKPATAFVVTFSRPEDVDRAIDAEMARES